MKKYSSKSVKGRLDKLVGDYFRSRPCDRCYKKDDVQIHWSHIKSRRYLSTRWLLINSFSHCASCHRYFEDNPDAFINWINIHYPGRLEELQKVFVLNVQYKNYQLEELYDDLIKLLKQEGQSDG